ncbi:MAG: hypothetical protein HUJ13_00335, partial [Hydrogenovibrio crunogenus]|nr:hypothetical protein [Hydrogenovibrio crunogenus]
MSENKNMDAKTKKLTYFALGTVFAVFLIIGIGANDAANELNAEKSQIEQPKLSYLEANNVATLELLKAALPTKEQNLTYYQGRVTNAAIKGEPLADNWLVIELTLQADNRQDYAGSHDFFDKQMIMDVMQNTLDYLVANSQNPDDKGFSVRVSAKIESADKTPTGET